ncbi:MAG: DUF3990 domain-containing protein [Muribaculum sp.]|nr:DUF3990 domain-containing protein [Muribaculum sp.]
MTKLHHGSYMGIGKIDLSMSRPGKDFGKGFYLNPDYEQAFLWAEFVVNNRRNLANASRHQYDIVIGPIANDNVGRQIQFYMQGYWTIAQLIEKIRYIAKKSTQYFFGTEKSLTFLTKVNYHE